MIAACLFAAYVTAAPALNDVNIIRQRSEPRCEILAKIEDQTITLTRDQTVVTVPFPANLPDGWYRFELMWGNRYARFSDKAGNILYLPVTMTPPAWCGKGRSTGRR